MNFSRLLGPIKALALAFAATEVAAATPYVQKAVGEISSDLKTADPGAAFLKTANDAWSAMVADPNVTPSFTGVIGAVAHAFLS